MLMYEYWNDHAKLKNGEKRNLFRCIRKLDYIYKDIAGDVETRFHTSNYELDGPLPKGKKYNWINER